MGRDAAEAALEILRADVAFLATVTSGATNILDSGSMRMKELDAAETARRVAGDSKILGVSVQDAGETHLKGDIWRQMVVVRLIDRLKGFDGIRLARFALYAALNHQTAALTSGQGGAVQFQYTSRQGHRVDRTYNVHFETVVFTATVQKLEV